MNRCDVYAFLSGQRLGVLSSVSAEGWPQSALMGYAVTPELEMVFDTLRSSRKYGNLRDRSHAAFVVSEGEVTVQLEGVAEELRGAELGAYQEVYFAAWPECRAHLEWAGITYFVVRPRWIRYSDYGQASPVMEEFFFEGS